MVYDEPGIAPGQAQADRKAQEQTRATPVDEYAKRMRGMRGMTYEDSGRCSGSVVKPLRDMGYKIPEGATSDALARGKVKGIIPLADIDNNRQGDPGILNGYDWNKDGIVDHINAGVGQLAGETKPQIIDATSSDNTWPSGRNPGIPNNGQLFKAEAGYVNQTFAPFSTNHTPAVQMKIDFEQLER